LPKIRRLYAAQMQQMSEAITRYFPAGTKLTRPAGGMCLWVELPPEIKAMALYHRAMAAGISIAPGPIFSAKQKFENFIRINCGNPWTESIENAVRKLGDIMGATGAAGNGTRK